MLSAISATLFAIRFAMIAYAEVTPGMLSPATDAALFTVGVARWVAFAAGFFRPGLPLLPGLFGATPFTFVGTPLTLEAITAVRKLDELVCKRSRAAEVKDVCRLSASSGNFDCQILRNHGILCEMAKNIAATLCNDMVWSRGG